MPRIEYEKRIVTLMIRLYCRKAEGNRELCDECRELMKYAHMRLDRCRYGDHKTSCSRCTTHCYKPAMREKIKRVMRFSSPRMMLYHPIASIRHLIGF